MGKQKCEEGRKPASSIVLEEGSSKFKAKSPLFEGQYEASRQDDRKTGQKWWGRFINWLRKAERKVWPFLLSGSILLSPCAS
ncbi:MAG: hypothetical protein QW035_03770, partial [Candidatus Anstonellales archaeon]